MKRLYTHCATCQIQFERPSGWHYCSSSCEAGANAQPRPVDVARMALDVALETAMPWERAVVDRVVRKANECPDAVVKWLRTVRCFDARLLEAMRGYALAQLNTNTRKQTAC